MRGVCSYSFSNPTFFILGGSSTEMMPPSMLTPHHLACLQQNIAAWNMAKMGHPLLNRLHPINSVLQGGYTHPLATRCLPSDSFGESLPRVRNFIPSDSDAATVTSNSSSVTSQAAPIDLTLSGTVKVKEEDKKGNTRGVLRVY